ECADVRPRRSAARCVEAEPPRCLKPGRTHSPRGPMPPFESSPAPALGSTTPVARGLWCWPALLPAAALARDAAWRLPVIRPGFAVTWLDVAALAGVAWAAFGRQRARRYEWLTPVDG